MDVLQIENLSFRYPDAERDALTQVSLSVKAGEFAVICGESGCGKSTLLKLLKREVAPYGELSGSIAYLGTPLAQLDSRTAATDIGFVLQDPDSQIVTDTVWHELAFGLENLGIDTSVIRRRVAEMAGYFGIEDWFYKKTAELSGGQKQLLNLAAVMVMQPKVLLLDEPTAQLDPIAASNFIATLQKLNRELGLTILLVEHRLEEVFPVADRVLLIDGGRLVYADAPRKIGAYFADKPAHPMLAALPAAMRVFHLLEADGEAPLTVREGRAFVTERYDNRISSLPEEPTVPQGDCVVELKDAWFRYEKELPDVLKGLSLSVYRGEHLCVLGGNGAGKSTLLSVIAGLHKVYRGKVLLNGKRVEQYHGNALYRHGLALLPQNPQTVFLEKTVGEDLRETCTVMQYTPDEAKQRITQITQLLGIEHLLAMHPYDISGGEQQKAALAKLLLLQPKVLLLDEPTKGIDAYAKQTLAALLVKLKAEMTVITVTHDVEFAAATADRCAMMFDGAMTSIDTPRAFFAENNFYTTAANRLSRGYYEGAVLCEQVAALCRLNGEKAVAK
ncbi:MAG: ATP-binding cassette domain-containing protein [Clostridia bacterium]|nr:ATP-binding cassette domain-containing protein [Clostridia bacterium]